MLCFKAFNALKTKSLERAQWFCRLSSSCIPPHRSFPSHSVAYMLFFKAFHVLKSKPTGAVCGIAAGDGEDVGSLWRVCPDFTHQSFRIPRNRVAACVGVSSLASFSLFFESLYLVIQGVGFQSLCHHNGSADRRYREYVLIARATHSDAHDCTPHMSHRVIDRNIRVRMRHSRMRRTCAVFFTLVEMLLYSCLMQWSDCNEPRFFTQSVLRNIFSSFVCTRSADHVFTPSTCPPSNPPQVMNTLCRVLMSQQKKTLTFNQVKTALLKAYPSFAPLSLVLWKSCLSRDALVGLQGHTEHDGSAHRPSS
jgi:hypothetical protein